VKYPTKDCAPDDILIITDPDIVLRPSTYNAIRDMDLSESEVIIVSDWFMYYMDYKLSKMPYTYNSAYLYRNVKPDEWEITSRNVWKISDKVVDNAGWHFAKLGGADGVIKNISGYPHLELDTDGLKTREKVQSKIDKGEAWDGVWPGERVLFQVPYDPVNYPQYINEHPEIYAKYFLGGMNAPV
jgi:hypothetical protein